MDKEIYLAGRSLFGPTTAVCKAQSQAIEGTIEETALLSGPVHIGRGAVVHAQAIIHGPSIVGPDAVINSHTEIRSGCLSDLSV